MVLLGSRRIRAVTNCHVTAADIAAALISWWAILT
jgi:hypothetical protein